MVEETGKDARREIAIGKAVAHLAIKMRMLDAKQTGIDHFRLDKMTNKGCPS